MKINEKIIDALKECNIKVDDALPYLISLHHGYNPSYIPDILKQKMNITGIYEKDDKSGTIKWNEPLYFGGATAFDWVKTEYVPMFKAINPQRGGKVRESMARMKRIFADNPDIRKQDVLAATDYYLTNTDPAYIRFPHYFIEKGKGINKTNDLLDWIDKVKALETVSQGIGRVDKSNTMQ